MTNILTLPTRVQLVEPDDTARLYARLREAREQFTPTHGYLIDTTHINVVMEGDDFTEERVA
jgi:hypothetical protein